MEVAILLFDGAQILDFTGPWETFGQAGYRVTTVAPTLEPIRTNMGLRLLPDHDLERAPAADVLVVPGGRIPHRLSPEDPRARWLRERSESARFVLTVCNGTFALGPAGLARGRAVTTNAGMIDHLEAFLPGARAVYDARFVEDGKVISAGGLSAGIDAALHVVAQLDSPGRAQEVANQMEYHWDPEGSYARTRLADFELSMALDFDPPLRKEVVRYEGDESRWVAEFLVRRPEGLAAFAEQWDGLARARGWSGGPTASDDEGVEAHWHYRDHGGRPWSLRSRLETTPEPGRLRMRVEVTADEERRD